MVQGVVGRSKHLPSSTASVSNVVLNTDQWPKGLIYKNVFLFVTFFRKIQHARIFV